jgi:hypothetical protein
MLLGVNMERLLNAYSSELQLGKDQRTLRAGRKGPVPPSAAQEPTMVADGLCKVLCL